MALSIFVQWSILLWILLVSAMVAYFAFQELPDEDEMKKKNLAEENPLSERLNDHS
jgi:hypothetical protein